MKCLEQSNSYKEKVEWWLLGVGGRRNGGYDLMGTEFLCGECGVLGEGTEAQNPFPIPHSLHIFLLAVPTLYP